MKRDGFGSSITQRKKGPKPCDSASDHSFSQELADEVSWAENMGDQLDASLHTVKTNASTLSAFSSLLIPNLRYYSILFPLI